MSKRNTLCGVTSKAYFSVFFFSLLTLLIAGSTPTLAQMGTWVTIGSKNDVPLGSLVDIDVYLWQDSLDQHSFGSFGLLITYDPQALTCVGVYEGELLDLCGWEMFEYQQGQLIPGKQAVRLRAVAETNNGAHHPSCLLGGKSGQFASLRFRLTSDSAYMWQNMTDIRYYWNDCTDNTFLSPAGDTVFFSDSEYFGSPSHLGTTSGAPDSCLGIADGRTHTRLIKYWGGYVANWPPDSIDDRGDLNLNGILNEMADLVLYINYFWYGIAAFDPVYYGASIAASDVNKDGIVLTYQDAVYLMRIYFGDVWPYPKRPTSDSLDAYFFQDTTNHRVEVTYDGQLAGAYLLFRGNITPTFTYPVDSIWGGYFFEEGVTRIVMLGEPDHRHSSGVWFTYTGEGTLFAAATADYFDSRITSHITGAGIPCGDFNGSGWPDISDAIYLVSFIFAGGPPPIDGHNGDTNCDGMVNISDVVSLIAYIYSGGPAPCASCK